MVCLQSPGLCPGVVSSLDVAHSLIHFGICPFTLGRRKESQGVKEGERVREELSNHIWVDGTHGESTAVSPHFSCMLSPGRYVLQPFLFDSSEIHLPNSLRPGRFRFSTFCFYPIRAHYTLSSLLPLGLNRSQMLQHERQLRSVIFFFRPMLQEVGPFGKRKEERKEESHRVQGSTEREEQKLPPSHLGHLITHVGKSLEHSPLLTHVCVPLFSVMLKSSFDVFLIFWKMGPARDAR